MRRRSSWRSTKQDKPRPIDQSWAELLLQAHQNMYWRASRAEITKQKRKLMPQMATWGRSQSSPMHPWSRQEENQAIQTRTWLPSTREQRITQAIMASSSRGSLSSRALPMVKPNRQTPAVAASHSFLVTPSHGLDLPPPLPARLSSPTCSLLKPPRLKMIIFRCNRTLAPSR